MVHVIERFWRVKSTHIDSRPTKHKFLYYISNTINGML